MKTHFFIKPFFKLIQIFFCLLFYTNLPAQTITKGVSIELAKWRKQTISDVMYRLQFNIPLQKDSPVNGNESISFSLKQIEQPLQIDFKGNSDQVISITANKNNIPINYTNEHIIIDKNYLVSGENEVTIHFVAGNQSLNRNDNYLYTLLVPDRARTVFPCFDQPDLKAIFKLTLTFPKDWQASANGVLKDSALSDKSKIYYFANSDTISTYLFSFVAGKFFKVTQNCDRAMNFLYRETDTTKVNNSIPVIFQTQCDALKFLEAYTGMPFPFQKFDFVAIPSFQFGGMEHVGNIYYHASTLFLNKGATQNQINNRINVLAHETSHMWFGDLVTMKWFDDVWVKEVYAQFMADEIAQKELPSQNFQLLFITQHYPSAYNVDRTSGANPIHQPLKNLQDAGTLYGNIIYDKAPIMMKQLEMLIGKDTLMFGLRKYLKRYAFGNASWDDLINILEKESHHNLKKWDDVWVNMPGRPIISSKINYAGKKITSFSLRQKAEYGVNKNWPQLFSVAFIYEDRIDTVQVNMNDTSVELKSIVGKDKPLSILFNSTGDGYGVFPVDTNMFNNFFLVKDPVMRASFCINAYESMLNRSNVSPKQLLLFYLNNELSEKEELTLKLITRQITSIFWKLFSPRQRIEIAPFLEEKLWNAMNLENISGNKKVLLNAYESIATSKTAQDNLYRIWKDKKPPENIILSDDDYTYIASELAVRNYPDKEIIDTQLSRITDADRKNKFAFIIPALSSNPAIRDSFFNSLLNRKNRRNEDWVLDALDYLHHPLRTGTSIKYLERSLGIIEEIQQTGDVFFLGDWLHANLDNYQTPQAEKIVTHYLGSHKGLNPKLKAKILQAADGLFRASKIVYGY